MGTVKWGRHHPGGYEVSSKGDVTYSALSARMSDGRTIEQWYQCDVKGYEPGGTNWRLGKGKKSLINYPGDHRWQMYLSLWKFWIIRNPQAFTRLAELVPQHDWTLTDRFASTDINQARALATLLNEWWFDRQE